MTKQDYINFAEEFHKDGLAVTLKKNSDYSGEGEDFFKNFRALSMHGIDPRIGFIARMQDKMNRIANYVKTGTLSVQDESVMDTFSDLANYTILFAAFCKDMEESAPYTKYQTGGIQLWMDNPNLIIDEDSKG